MQDGGARTPMSSLIKAAAAAATGTPYQTAENCSKCRFDKLETSAYWHAQIKVAEAAGKHSVSAAFFRLALECHAQVIFLLIFNNNNMRRDYPPFIVLKKKKMEAYFYFS